MHSSDINREYKIIQVGTDGSVSGNNITISVSIQIPPHAILYVLEIDATHVLKMERILPLQKDFERDSVLLDGCEEFGPVRIEIAGLLDKYRIPRDEIAPRGPALADTLEECIAIPEGCHIIASHLLKRREGKQEGFVEHVPSERGSQIEDIHLDGREENRTAGDRFSVLRLGEGLSLEQETHGFLGDIASEPGVVFQTIFHHAPGK